MEHIVTPDLRPWKVLTPLTPKHTSFESKFFCFRFPYVIKEFMISKIRLLALIQKAFAAHLTIMVSDTNPAQCCHAHLPNLQYPWL